MEQKSLICFKWGMIFYFLDISIGSLNLLPDFVGVILFYLSVQSHEQQTQTEKRVKSLLLILGADCFIHWIWHFENNLEGLVAFVISLYVIFILTGEVAERIRLQQPDRARQLEVIRICIVLLQCAAFLVVSYKIQSLSMLATIGVVMACIVFMLIVSRISPLET